MLSRYAAAALAVVLLTGASALLIDVGGNCDRVPTDLNHDCVTNSGDLAAVAQHFNEHVPTYTPTVTPTATPAATSTPAPATTPLSMTPNDPKYSTQWNLAKIAAPQAWAVSHGGGVIVALLDSGIAPNMDLAPLVGYNALDDTSNTYDDLGSYGSGTQSASIIAAITNNGVGLAGINWNLQIMPVKVIRSDGVVPAGVLAKGITWAVNHDAQVIQISAALSASSPDIDAAIADALGRGVIVVAASGNVASHVGYPASIPGVIAVGATDQSDVVGTASGRGPELDLVAPGVLVPVIVSGGCCLAKTGTELAAAHLTGAIALLLSEGVTNPELVLERTAVDLGIPGRDDVYGYGRLQLCGAGAC